MPRSTTARHSMLLPSLLALTFLVAAPLLADKNDPDRLQQKVERALEVYQELKATPDKGVPEALEEEARCIAIFPSVIKGAIGWGGRHGRGVILCKDEDDDWSAPAFFQISGGSVGFQIGAESTDLVLYFLTDRSVESLLESKFTLGGDIGVAAGPLGRSAEASTDLKMRAEILSYAKSRGLFAGVSLEGARVSADLKAIRAYYGQKLWAEEILYQRESFKVPSEAKALRRALP